MMLPSDWAASLTKPATGHHKPGIGNYAGRGYSYHFWLPEKESGVFMAVGVYGQFVWIDHKRQLVIARNSADPEWTPRYNKSEAVMRAIAAHYD